MHFDVYWSAPCHVSEACMWNAVSFKGGHTGDSLEVVAHVWLVWEVLYATSRNYCTIGRPYTVYRRMTKVLYSFSGAHKVFFVLCRRWCWEKSGTSYLEVLCPSLGLAYVNFGLYAYLTWSVAVYMADLLLSVISKHTPELQVCIGPQICAVSSVYCLFVYFPCLDREKSYLFIFASFVQSKFCMHLCRKTSHGVYSQTIFVQTHCICAARSLTRWRTNFA